MASLQVCTTLVKVARTRYLFACTSDYKTLTQNCRFWLIASRCVPSLERKSIQHLLEMLYDESVLSGFFLFYRNHVARRFFPKQDYQPSEAKRMVGIRPALSQLVYLFKLLAHRIKRELVT